LNNLNTFLSPYIIDHILGMHFLTYPREQCIDFQLPTYEDFVVREIVDLLNLEGPLEYPAKGSLNCLYMIKKVGSSTVSVAEQLRHILRCRKVRYLGLKETRAIAYQYMVCEDCSTCIDSIERPRWSASLILRSYGGVYLLHKGNEFELTLHCSEDSDLVRLANKLSGSRTKLTLLNYFGYQRFGLNRPITHLVGASILHNDVDTLVSLLCTESPAWSAPPRTGYENYICKLIHRHTLSLKKVLELMSFKLIKLFLEAYQSYLFNKALSFLWMEILKRSNYDLHIALKTMQSVECVCIGYDTDIDKLHEPMRNCYIRVLDIEGLEFRDLAKLFKRWKVRTVPRKCVVEPIIEGVTVLRRAVRLRVLMPRGSYVTIFLRELNPCKIENIILRH